MKSSIAAVLSTLVVCTLPALAAETPLRRPQPGPVETMKTSELKPGMKGTAWTVFEGTEPEPVPIEIIGLWKNAWGPKQDVILAKMGGKAARTNVAGGMSGSPVYIDGKLVGAVALRLSVFSPDAICGITPIDLMLEINDLDQSRPADARTPDKASVRRAAADHPGRPAGPGGRRRRLARAARIPRHGAHRNAALPLRLQRRNPARVRPHLPASSASTSCRAARAAPFTPPSPPPAGRLRSNRATPSPACWFPAT